MEKSGSMEYERWSRTVVWNKSCVEYVSDRRLSITAATEVYDRFQPKKSRSSFRGRIGASICTTLEPKDITLIRMCTTGTGYQVCAQTLLGSQQLVGNPHKQWWQSIVILFMLVDRASESSIFVVEMWPSLNSFYSRNAVDCDNTSVSLLEQLVRFREGFLQMDTKIQGCILLLPYRLHLEYDWSLNARTVFHYVYHSLLQIS